MSSLKMSSSEDDGRFGPGRAHIDAVVNERMGDTSRRRFLQIMGASMALATASGCTWETEEIVPFQRRPEGRVPGKSRRFATALECSGVASSLLVASYDGRPIKIEGNPDHPLDAGACSARTQAAVLDLYDPDHSRGLVQVHERVAYPRTWKEFEPYWAGEMARRRANGGAGLVILAEPSSSRTLQGLRQRWLEMFPRARWVEWEPVARTQAMAGAALAFGRAVRTQPRVRSARTLVCLDSDLFGDHPAAIANARAFAERRDPTQADMLRVWVVENTPTVTGAAADHRLALRAEQVLPFVLALEQRVQAALGGGLDPALKSNVSAPTGGFLVAAHVERFLASLASELHERRGDVLVTAGPRQPAVVHALVHRLNAALGNAGRTLVYTEEPEAERPDPAAAIGSLVRDMKFGTVECLVVLGGNPVYDAPADVDFAGALRQVPMSVHLSHFRDETSRACTWHLPRAHTLESWGDACSWDGTRCTTQPLIDPIHERRTVIEFVAASIGEKTAARDLVRAAIAPSATDAQWKRILHDGFVKDSQFAAVAPALVRFEVLAIEPRQMQLDLPNGQLEIVFAADARVFDGRSANNSWLQEVPDSITKMTWGNAATFSPATAAALGVADATLIKLRVGTRELEVAATVLPGQAHGSVTLHLGYGRTAAGQVGGLVEDGIDPIGFDAYRLRSSNALGIAAGLTVEPTGREYALARTTDPEVTDEVGRRGREERLEELLRETNLKRFREGGTEHAAHEEGHTSLWAAKTADAEGARWGMSIDLNTCIGCNACTVACQSENNIPVVGREQVIRGREMHWIRIDRYISGPNDSPKVRFQPMACQHCENAPCEQVCPVAATMHSAEGLNDMVYNRCVGTRYCANNCPFKVRRFNYFNYHKQIEKPGAEVERMIYNPEVTIRHRGVMEKCTFCVQRIQAAKIQAKNAGRPVADGDITPACAQTCPTKAIVFGDLADPKSRVARLHASQRSYTMLDELNIHPRTTYLTKVTNPHPDVDEHDG